MGLPPTTPASSRFLNCKRSSTQQSHSQTPSQLHARGQHQFNATPRFAASTPRPPLTQAREALATPALVIKPRAPRSRSTQDIIDDSSPISPGEDPELETLDFRSTLPEPIEFDSSLVPQSPSPDEGRSPKRRRISIASSESGANLTTVSQHSENDDIGLLPDVEDDHIVSYNSYSDDDSDAPVPVVVDVPLNSHPHQLTSSPAHPPSPSLNAGEQSRSEASENEFYATDSNDEDATNKPTTNAYKPAFRAAPRFKPTEPPDKTHAHHPDPYQADIFSPQRRGAKYLAGGLAAELRDWLVDVKGGADGEGEVQAASTVLELAPAAAMAKVRVDAVSHGGPGMTLVSGRLVEGRGLDGQDAAVRLILAGEGTIEGLGGGRCGGHRSRVAPGVVVSIAPPAWDIDLDIRWAVAYRWEVMESGGVSLA